MSHHRLIRIALLANRTDWFLLLRVARGTWPLVVAPYPGGLRGPVIAARPQGLAKMTAIHILPRANRYALRPDLAHRVGFRLHRIHDAPEAAATSQR